MLIKPVEPGSAREGTVRQVQIGLAGMYAVVFFGDLITRESVPWLTLIGLVVSGFSLTVMAAPFELTDRLHAILPVTPEFAEKANDWLRSQIALWILFGMGIFVALASFFES